MTLPIPISAACRRVAAALAGALLLAGCAHAPANARPATADFRVAPLPHEPLRFIIYGDMRFTAPTEVVASRPPARQALIAKIASERPTALFLTGDVPWRGGVVDDYSVFRNEAAPWRARALPVFPALGNHEFAQCEEAQCLENWWQAFPVVRGKRWYTVAMGPRIIAVALDSDASFQDGSAQRVWLDKVLGSLATSVDFVVFYLHHPPVTDPQVSSLASHNARPNEQLLAAFLRDASARSRARFIVCAGHVHNYSRHEQDGIVYLVSGGGGAQPYEIVRDAGDLYKDPGFPNFHYLRFTLTQQSLRAEMFRLEDFDSATPHVFALRDQFEVRRKRR